MGYPTDLNDQQWNLIKSFTVRSDARGAVRKHSMRQIINAILYVTKTGCQWRMLPKEFAPWETVYDHFRRFQHRGVWEEILLELNKKVREKKGVPPPPVISSSTLKVSKPTPKEKHEASTEAKKSKVAAGK